LKIQDLEMENSKLKKKLKELEDQLMDPRCSPVRSVGNESCLSFQLDAAPISMIQLSFSSLKCLFFSPIYLHHMFPPFRYSNLSFALSLSPPQPPVPFFSTCMLMSLMSRTFCRGRLPCPGVVMSHHCPA